MKTSMHYGASKTIFKFARQLRNNLTPSEIKLWTHLKEDLPEYYFRRQHPISSYIADFYCHDNMLIIEIDGSVHSLPEVEANDEVRQMNLEELGLKVIRFSAYEVMNDIVSVIETIKTEMRK